MSTRLQALYMPEGNCRIILAGSQGVATIFYTCPIPQEDRDDSNKKCLDT